jgi:hypothetical protein
MRTWLACPNSNLVKLISENVVFDASIQEFNKFYELMKNPMLFGKLNNIKFCIKFQ